MWIETSVIPDVPGIVEVTPHAGVWIETLREVASINASGGHSPRGSVD